jgi:enoyl-CoA hydratase/carnithine racemase
VNKAYNTIQVERFDDGHALVTLNRPDRLNAIDDQMFRELDQAYTELDDEQAVRAIVLTGAGRGFCAGLDLAEAAGLPAMTVPQMYRAQAAGARTLTRAREISTPVIAAVNGPASGGGLALALAADVRIAAPEAFFNVAFVRLGLTGCDVGVSWLLPRVVGLGHASEMMLTGRRVTADEAAHMGLVNRVVPAGELLDAACAVASQIAANSPFGVALTKEGLQLAIDSPSLQAALAIENRNQVLASRTADMTEALTAFMERRTARFTGE